MALKRSYRGSHMQWEFIKSVEKNGSYRPRCMLYHEVMMMESMYPSKSRAKLENIHSTHTSDSDDMFQRNQVLRFSHHEDKAAVTS